MLRFVLLMSIGSAALADALPEDDNGPLSGGIGLPSVEEGGRVLLPGKFRAGFSLITASHAIVEDAGAEQLILDGETIRAALDLRWGIRPGVEIGFELPYVTHQSGNLDSLIDTWHDIFGLPEGNRDDRPTDLLDFSYSDASGDRLNFTQSARGIGDLRIYGGIEFATTPKHQRALRLSVKFPTGDDKELLGSGGTDISLGIAGDISEFGGSPRVSAFYRGNVTYIGEPDLFADRYRELIGQASAGLAYAFNPAFQLNAQSTFRTAVYQSETEKLGEPSLTLTFGGNIRLRESMVLSLGVSEDIKVGSAPDVSFNIGVRYQPQ